MTDLQNIFKLQEEFEHYLHNKVDQLDVPLTIPTHKHVIEAIYYFQCMNVEFYEFLNASTKEDLLEELIDVLIFAVDVFLFLGIKSDNITNDINYYLDASAETSKKIIKDSCYGNNFLALIMGSKHNIAEDFVTHILATMNVIFSKLLYKDVAYKKWKKHVSFTGVIKSVDAVLGAMDGIFLLIFTLFKAAGFDAKDIYASFEAKIDKNMNRQKTGY